GFLATMAYLSYRRALPGDLAAARAHLAKAKHWAWYSVTLAATIATLGLAVAVFLANDAAVYRTFFDTTIITENAAAVLKGFWINVQLFLMAEVLILLLSVLVAVVRELPGRPAAPLRFLAAGYTDVFRSLPEILVLLIIGIGLPRSGLPVLGSFTAFQAALFALTVTYTAYIAEVVRGGLHSVHWSQFAAARSLGLTYLQAMRLVVIPQAMRNTVAPLLNGFISLQKGTALVSVLGVLDAVNIASGIASFTASLAPYTGVALLYLIVTVPLTRLTDYLTQRTRKRRLATT
ncbi:MAG: amino acid ABC transporter permease, partial [Candidatus Saccharimonadales bacterium]